MKEYLIFESLISEMYCSTEGSLPLVVRQLQYLWSKPIVTCLFGQVLHCDPEKQSTYRTSQSAVAVQNDLATSIQSKLFYNVKSC